MITEEIPAKIASGRAESNTSLVAPPVNTAIVVAPTALADRMNVVDSNFLLADNPSQRLRDVKAIFTTPSKIEAITLLNKYNVNFIFVSSQTLKEFNIDKIHYIDDKKCFKLIYNNKDVEVLRG